MKSYHISTLTTSYYYCDQGREHMTDAVKAQVGMRLRKKREQAGYTREKLGELCSLSPRFIANIELGDSTFSLDSLITVCHVLSCSSDYLLFGENIDWMYSKKVDKYAKLVDKRQQRKKESYIH